MRTAGPFLKGIEAQLDGLAEGYNPEAYGSEDWYAWRRGWRVSADLTRGEESRLAESAT